MSEQLNFFASLDFPGRTTLGLPEIADKLGCSVRHLLNEADAGSLVGLDISASRSARRAMRIPVECYRDYVLRKITGPTDMRMRFLRELPAAIRRDLIEQLSASLTTHP